MSYDTSGTVNGIIAYRHSTEDSAAASNPDPIAYGNGFRNQSTRYPLCRIE
jgi:hypothetical protein